MIDRHGTAVLDGKEFVLVPREEYLLLKHGKTVDAIAFSRKVIADDLKKIREKAGMTQTQLAKKLHCSQAMVARAEAGATRIGERYLRRVCKECGVDPNE
jgi:DNA-binding XRE family transcriptional regulator